MQTLKDYFKQKRNIRKNRRTNVKLNQRFDVSQTAYAQNKEAKKQDKLNAKNIKKQNKQSKKK